MSKSGVPPLAVGGELALTIEGANCHVLPDIDSFTYFAVGPDGGEAKEVYGFSLADIRKAIKVDDSVDLKTLTPTVYVRIKDVQDEEERWVYDCTAENMD
eukprot:PhF_6_TR27128/c3_g1_i1/m.39554